MRCMHAIVSLHICRQSRSCIAHKILTATRIAFALRLVHQPASFRCHYTLDKPLTHLSARPAQMHPHLSCPCCCPQVQQSAVPQQQPSTSSAASVVAAAAPRPEASPFLDPLVRSLILGVGAGMLCETGHVLFKVSSDTECGGTQQQQHSSCRPGCQNLHGACMTW
jgi:hypothetical protein